MFRYKLRTLLILLAVVPPIVALAVRMALLNEDEANLIFGIIAFVIIVWLMSRIVAAFVARI